MAPRGTPKRPPQVSQAISRAKSTTMSVKKTTETLRLKENTTELTTKSAVTTVSKLTTKSTVISTTVKEKRFTEPRQRTRTEPPKVATPKSKENKAVIAPGSVTKSAKKAAWRRRPKPAHSGVPVPEKMRKLLEKYLQDDDAM